MNFSNNLVLLFTVFCILPVIASAQNSVLPSITKKGIEYFKAQSNTVLDIEQQVFPFHEKILIHFKELGFIYNPAFPETRNPVRCTNFYEGKSQYTYLSRSLSTYRATFVANGEGRYYGAWNDRQCKSLLEFEVKRVGDKLVVTGKVYTNCLSES